mmetsp:Transcript_27035/g.58647  ORF Transcript_27035/g.58647 Transcript_27035/m.58647 type:complete len:212 (-) Transcript_27035:170-805(-)
MATSAAVSELPTRCSVPPPFPPPPVVGERASSSLVNAAAIFLVLPPPLPSEVEGEEEETEEREGRRTVRSNSSHSSTRGPYLPLPPLLPLPPEPEVAPGEGETRERNLAMPLPPKATSLPPLPSPSEETSSAGPCKNEPAAAAPELCVAVGAGAAVRGTSKRADAYAALRVAAYPLLGLLVLEDESEEGAEEGAEEAWAIAYFTIVLIVQE